MKIFLHTRSYGKTDWKNESREVRRLPVVGEYVALAENDLYQVQAVVHCAFEATYEGEVTR